MKKIITLLVLAFSLTAFAQTKKVEATEAALNLGTAVVSQKDKTISITVPYNITKDEVVKDEAAEKEISELLTLLLSKLKNYKGTEIQYLVIEVEK